MVEGPQAPQDDSRRRDSTRLPINNLTTEPARADTKRLTGPEVLVWVLFCGTVFETVLTVFDPSDCRVPGSGSVHFLPSVFSHQSGTRED